MATTKDSAEKVAANAAEAEEKRAAQRAMRREVMQTEIAAFADRFVAGGYDRHGALQALDRLAIMARGYAKERWLNLYELVRPSQFPYPTTCGRPPASLMREIAEDIAIGVLLEEDIGAALRVVKAARYLGDCARPQRLGVRAPSDGPVLEHAQRLLASLAGRNALPGGDMPEHVSGPLERLLVGFREGLSRPVPESLREIQARIPVLLALRRAQDQYAEEQRHLRDFAALLHDPVPRQQRGPFRLADREVRGRADAMDRVVAEKTHTFEARLAIPESTFWEGQFHPQSPVLVETLCLDAALAELGDVQVQVLVGTHVVLDRGWNGQTPKAVFMPDPQWNQWSQLGHVLRVRVRRRFEKPLPAVFNINLVYKTLTSENV